MSGLNHNTPLALIRDIEASIETKRAILGRHVPVRQSARAEIRPTY
jgi:hypothetical protein